MCNQIVGLSIRTPSLYLYSIYPFFYRLFDAVLTEPFGDMFSQICVGVISYAYDAILKLKITSDLLQSD